MANHKNTIFYSIDNTAETVPASASGTGTLKTVGKGVVGTNTLFKTEMRAGSWLVDLSQNEIRKVVHVASNTEAELDYAFTSDIAAGTTPDIIAYTDLNIKSISVAISSLLAQGEIDGNTLNPGGALTWQKNSSEKTDSRSFVEPIIADATGTVIDVTILR